MSSLIVKVVKITEIVPHSNADRLEVALIGGWRCIVAKERFKVGDLAIYIPIDSVLSEAVEGKLFTDSKVKPSKGRIKSVKIRGEISQGLLAPLDILDNPESKKEGDDVAAELGITKYEPPDPSMAGYKQFRSKAPRKRNHNFKKYTDIENLRYYGEVFTEGEFVQITEKLHGTSARFSWALKDKSLLNWWQRFLFWLGTVFNKKSWQYTWVVGSRNMDLNPELFDNIYTRVADFYSLKRILNYGEAVYGEIVGEGIQKGFDYGLKGDDKRLYLYDVMVDGKYLNHEAFLQFCSQRYLPVVPQLYRGVYKPELIKLLASGPSKLTKNHIREGIVVKPVSEENCKIGRKVLKYVSDEYLLKDTTDFH